MESPIALSSSFRDPDGFVYKQGNQIYRQIHTPYKEAYDHLMTSGLYTELVEKNLLVSHEELPLDDSLENGVYRIIKPQMIPYVSYPYEWSFSQLKDAARATIDIQLIALRYGMTLKDASAYNIQFRGCTPIFIDTLSFDFYKEGSPWSAYRQFCQHFTAPLALMSYKDVRLSQLLRANLDGVPLDLTSKLLPISSWFKYSLLAHIHLHAKSQSMYSDIGSNLGDSKSKKSRPISKLAYRALMESIKTSIEKLTWRLADTEWGNYYSATNYADSAMRHKEEIVKSFFSKISSNGSLVHDLGANDGHFSRLVSNLGYPVISQDIDPTAVEKNYLAGKNAKDHNILPLLLDLTNPSSSIGWQLKERDSFIERNDGVIVMALALVHHLAIGNNVPLVKVAEMFAEISETLIIEFVPKEDSQVIRLLATRKDIFPNYDQEGFQEAFEKYFVVDTSVKIRESERTLYLYTRK